MTLEESAMRRRAVLLSLTAALVALQLALPAWADGPSAAVAAVHPESGSVATEASQARVIIEYHIRIIKNGQWLTASTHRLRSDAERKATYYRSQGYYAEVRTVVR